MAGCGGFNVKKATNRAMIEGAISLVPTAKSGPAANPPEARTTLPAVRPARLTPVDHEFLPAALEILVKPPSPIARALLLAICALFLAALAWSYFGWMDIYAVAQGKI